MTPAGLLAAWNFLSPGAAADEILPCCGSRAWAQAMASRRPLLDEHALYSASDEIWDALPESDWQEAFRAHPRIGESPASSAHPQSAVWSGEEQNGLAEADGAVRVALAQANQEYERRFNRIFIVCATGKSPGQVLQILRGRLKNGDRVELLEAAEQQRQITRLRLAKWLREYEP
jgi:2-oxo-4-hydroxy-4-carboxy-5-ureidoimidazoline decarboxylase